LNIILDLNKIEAFVFDFDGVLTDNLVHIDCNANEWVTCSRADGLAFDVLKKLKKISLILSTEKNKVVSARAKKLGIIAIQGVENKEDALKIFASNNNINVSNTLFVGNDLNDYNVMKICGYSVCPNDSHMKIKEISDIVLRTPGGKGVVREILEDVFELDFVSILNK